MATGAFVSTANLPLYTNHGPESLVPKSLGQEGLLKSMEPPLEEQFGRDPPGMAIGQ